MFVCVWVCFVSLVFTTILDGEGGCNLKPLNRKGSWGFKMSSWTFSNLGGRGMDVQRVVSQNCPQYRRQGTTILIVTPK